MHLGCIHFKVFLDPQNNRAGWAMQAHIVSGHDHGCVEQLQHRFGLGLFRSAFVDKFAAFCIFRSKKPVRNASLMLELENSRSAGEGAPAHNARENTGEQGFNSSISYIYALLYYLLSRYLIIIYLINTAACMLNSGFRHHVWLTIVQPPTWL